MFVCSSLQIDDIRLTPSEVWTPDIEAYNGNKEPTFLANKNTIVVSNSEFNWDIFLNYIMQILFMLLLITRRPDDSDPSVQVHHLLQD